MGSGPTVVAVAAGMHGGGEGSNPRHLRCKRSALPLSNRPFRLLRGGYRHSAIGCRQWRVSTRGAPAVPLQFPIADCDCRRKQKGARFIMPPPPSKGKREGSVQRILQRLGGLETRHPATPSASSDAGLRIARLARLTGGHLEGAKARNATPLRPFSWSRRYD